VKKLDGTKLQELFEYNIDQRNRLIEEGPDVSVVNAIGYSFAENDIVKIMKLIERGKSLGYKSSEIQNSDLFEMDEYDLPKFYFWLENRTIPTIFNLLSDSIIMTEFNYNFDVTYNGWSRLREE